MGKFILTSTGLSAPPIRAKINDLVALLPKNRAVIITTAAEDKEQNKYCLLAKQQLLELNFKEVMFLDLESEGIQKLSNADVVYVSGGNTFKLMKFARERNFESVIKTIANTNTLFIGVSAGSIILGKSIEIAGIAGGDANEVGLKDLSGFELINNDIHPHYVDTQEEEIKKYENKHTVKVLRITDDEAIMYDNKLSYIK
jgi:dipeptidase E